MDNATYHRNKNNVSFITSAGMDVLFLPPSSSELNPIEHCWAHIKKRVQNRRLEHPQHDFRVLVDEVMREYQAYTAGNRIANKIFSKILRPLEGFLV